MGYFLDQDGSCVNFEAEGRHNHLLLALGATVFGRVARHMERVVLRLGHVVCEAGGPLVHAYFPEGGVLSLLTMLEDGTEIECATIGREGAFGLFSAMYSRVSFNRCVVPLAGPMIRCPIEALRAEFEADPAIRNLFVSYAETLLSQVMQSAACHAQHTVRARMCRWLLMMHDRASGETLRCTHAFLSRVLGANRTSVTIAAQSLQDGRLIRYSRGTIQMCDRPGIEAASCECYRVVKARFEAFLRPPPTALKADDAGRTRPAVTEGARRAARPAGGLNGACR